MRNPSKPGQQVAETLDQLARHFDLSDAELARATGLARTTVQQRRRGTRGMKFENVPAFAEAFGIPIDVLYMERGAAIRWVLDNVENGGMPAAGDQELPAAVGDDEQGKPGTVWNPPTRRHLALVAS